MEQPIRILHVVAKMNRAGTETMLMNFYRHIDREKVQFDFAVCTDEHCDYEDEIISMGGKLIRYPQYKGKNHLTYKKWWNHFFGGHPGYRIIHGHIGSTAAIYLGIAKKYGCYTIAHSHCTLEPLSIRSLIWRAYSYPTRHIADHFFGCSMVALETRYGVKVAHDKVKAQVLNNAIEAKKYTFNSEIRKRVREELGIKEDEHVIGTIGRLSPQKNPHMTIKILEELKKRGEKFRFIWVGVGELKKKIEVEIKDKGLSDNVMMLGLRDDVQRILQAMDVFLFPSICEGLGIVAIEAQAAGLPTMCSDQVPTEAKVTDLCSFLPLTDVKKWCEMIINTVQSSSQSSNNRINSYNDIVKAGYDIEETAKWLQSYYVAI